MSGHENALVRALIERLRADAGVRAVLGHPARVWDAAPADAGWPRLLIGSGESRPVAADGCGIEHRLTLTAASRARGAEEARAVLAAVRGALEGARLEADGVRVVTLRLERSEVARSRDGLEATAAIRLRAVTETIEEDEQ